MVLNRLRIGQIVYHANHAAGHGRIGELIMEELFMNGRQSFQQLRADVDARASVDASIQADGRFKNIQKSFDALVAKGFVVRADKLQVRRQTVFKLPPKTRGAKNKRHLQGAYGASTEAGSKRGRLDYFDDEDEDMYSDDDDELPEEMRPQRNRARSGSLMANRWIGDGEWKEDAGYGPITEEVIYDADRIACAKREEREAAEAAVAESMAAAKAAIIKVEDLTGDANDDNDGIVPSKQGAGVVVKKRTIHDDEDDDDDDDFGAAGVKGSVVTGVGSAGGGGTTIKSDWAGGKPVVDERSGMWTVGWSQLVNEERHGVCVKYTTDRMQAKAGRIVKIILDASSGDPRSVYQVPIAATDTSLPLSLVGIFDEFKRRAAETASSADSAAEKVLDLPTFKRLLQLLVEDNILAESTAFTTTPTGSRESRSEYSVRVGDIIHRLKRKTFQSIAATRFGLSTARIVEFLTSNNQLIEQQQLSDKAIMPAREATQDLYKLYRDNWIDYRDVPKRTDYNPSSTHYFWSLDQARLKGVVLNHCYKTLLNLRLRCVACQLRVAHHHHSLTTSPLLPPFHSLTHNRRAHVYAEQGALSDLHFPFDSKTPAPDGSAQARAALERLDRAVLGMAKTILVLGL